MTLLQKFGFKESAYLRPQDKWVCGRLAEGKPCSLGPGGNGSCRVTSVCQPNLEDGRWECRRSALEGGACEAGPLPDGRCCKTMEPCAPQPSLRYKRKRVALWATALAVGLVVLILGGGRAADYLMPGPLSSPHANQGECKSCHAGVETENLEWLHGLVTEVGPKENSKLCISCHDVGAQPFAPHTHPVEQLRRLTERYGAGQQDRAVQNDSWVHRIAFPGPKAQPATGEPEVFCATCHEEHQGVFQDLTTVSNQRCQTCHVSKFGSLSQSHPELKNYPFDRRTRIIFDHKSHFGKHFPKTAETASLAENVPGVCADCHEPGAGQKYMEIRSYESTCLGCHDGDIQGTTRASGPKGIDFIAVPGLDVATLNERGIDIGDWPEDSEAELTAFMRTLLAGEAMGKDVVSGVQGLDLLDLTEASDEELAHVETLAWSVKQLFDRLEKADMSAAMELAKMSPGSVMDHTQMTRLTGGMSHDVIMAGNRDWFPNLKDDLSRHVRGEPTRAFTPAPEPLAPTSEQAAALVAEQPEPSNDDILGGGSQDSLEAGGNDLEPSGDILGGPGDSLDGGGLLGGDADADDLPPGLSVDEPSDILGGSSDDTIALSGDDTAGDILGGDSEDGDILGGDDAADGLDGLLSGDEQQADGPDGLTVDEAKDGSETIEANAEPFDPEGWAEFGGWYRQDFSIRYRPSGHADRFLRTWLDFSGEGYGKEREGLLAPVFDRLAPQDAVGRCTKCHSVDDEPGAKHVKWRAFNTRRVKNRFTTFSHEPHISAVGSQGCMACHALSPAGGGDFLKTYESGDPASYVQNFVDLDKGLCASCHTEKAAGETCTLCHNYHATEFSRPLVRTKIP